MKIYYGIDANGCAPQPLNEMYVDRILNKHGNEGLVILSANRTGLDPRINNENTKKLIADIQRTGRSYIPVYGGYHDDETGITDSYEPSFIVTNYDREGDVLDFDELKDFAIQMCGKYDQWCVTVKAPDDVPHFYDRNGNIISKNDTDKVIKNDPTQTYFTSLIKSKNIDYAHPERTKRFTYVMDQPDEQAKDGVHFECYVNPHPCTLNERRYRDMRGEIIFGRWYNGKFIFD
ncbi:MAG: hypothetical protein LUD72_10295 [Bacteroidales bacterium]|nr:hypothetical protein [Bacteroidales bacterium]